MLTEQEFSRSCKSLLKRILFDKSHLNSLKQDIKDFSENEITSKELKKRILIAKSEVLENLLETLPIYVQSIQPLGGYSKESKNDVDKSKVTMLKVKLQEREELLQIIARRLQNLTLKNLHSRPEKINPKLTGKTFILDGSNIARHNQGSEKGALEDVIGSKNVLLNAGIPEENIFIIFGPGLYHHLPEEDTQTYKKLLENRNVVQVPAGVDDDWFIIQHGMKHTSYIITNDLYSKYKEKGEDYKEYIENYSIRYSIIGNDIYFEKELEAI